MSKVLFRVKSQPTHCPMCDNLSVFPALVAMPVLVEGSPVKSLIVKGWKCTNCKENFYSEDSMRIMEKFRKTLKEQSSAATTA